MTRRRVENREELLGHPRFVRPEFTKDSKPLGKWEKVIRVPRDCDTRTHLKKCNNRIVMEQRKHLDDFLCGRIIGRLECGRTQLEVSEELGIAQSVISRL
ncbi:cubilin [Trichonephila clavipes]|nr:cubilin [Trichonephila clavipes]